ncbi:coenzyme F420 hydrogenase/dehydrogenase beta subunit N-terminal domain-containing protein [Fibrobacter sp.]|uniref:coenzyme F420 hydrogenase/dehydrogenase beta subunit N-terminal domain-containing protein n=1 Tax=Fibrobacter sp. TaxID=35828 RepID=UPI00263A06E6|nr:coenzyme F420 hydrogenase/dehydrogenase beta subunit N-terminal domain-containing protein [Fibrobacter sp.]MDD5943982.1 coenzyme F420 hydrogenase/dehydrogenase beta subunit N-terminal domain-containing protein [Fibrobacter sp.]
MTPRLRAARARLRSRERPVSKMVAACAKDESVRLQSSGGGIFTVLAERVLDDGGVVVGVAQTAPTRFGHIVVENKADLAKRHQFPRQVGRLERLCAAASFWVRKIRFGASWSLEIHAPVPEPHLSEYILRW